MAAMKDITIDVTYAELTALIANSGLFQGVNYLITDRGDRGLLFKAASRTQLEIQGTRYMLCPATYKIGADAHSNNWIGVWNSAKTAAVNDLVIWNGQVWKCIVEVIEPLDSPDANTVNWALIPKGTFTNHEYIEMIFSVRYDVTNDWIIRQYDLNGNEFGCSYLAEQAVFTNGFNTCDYSDWNYATSEYEFFDNCCLGFYNNECHGIYKNKTISLISGNFVNGNIHSNDVIGITDMKSTLAANIAYNKGSFGITSATLIADLTGLESNKP